MQRVPVKSSNLRAVGYDASSQTLEIEFHHGGVYQYFHVPPFIHERLMSAASHGSYFDQHIRQGGYNYTKVG